MSQHYASGRARGVAHAGVCAPQQSRTYGTPTRLSSGTLALTSPVAPLATGHRGDAVAQWSLEHRLLEAAKYGVGTLPHSIQAQLLLLFTPENALITGSVMAAWAASHAYGVGEVVDAGLFAFAVYTTGRQAFDGVRDLAHFASEASAARSEADLRSAGHWFAQAVLELGVAALTALILKRGLKTAGPTEEAAATSGAGGLSAAEIDALADDMIKERFLSTQNVGTQVVQNVKTIVRFLSEQGVGREKMIEVLRGIDLHAAQPVQIVEFEQGEIVAQFAADGRTGSWFTRAARGATEDDLGISAGKRTRQLFRVKSRVKMLKSRAASVVDTWTEGREGQVLSPNPVKERPISDKPILSEPTPKVRAGQYTRGGGEQFFLPNAPRFVEPVK